MPDRDAVVPKIEPLTEEQFRAVFLQSLHRMIGTHGESKVALWLGVCSRQLRNIKAGSLPAADRIFNLLAHDEGAHDEIDRKYGLRKVPHHSVCSTDPLAAQLSRLLTHVIEAEDENSPGGHEVTLREIRQFPENIMRTAHRRLGAWLDRLDNEREAPTLRAVGR